MTLVQMLDSNEHQWRICELALWIDDHRPEWRAKGVDVLERAGMTLFPWRQAIGELDGTRRVFVGTIEACELVSPDLDQFVQIIVGPDMSGNHAALLIENAVEQVAGR